MLNMSDSYIYIVIGYLAFIGFVLTTVFMNFARGEKDCRNIVPSILLIFAEVVFTIVGPILGFMRYDEYGPEIPFSKRHVLIIIILVISSSLSFWLAKFSRKEQGPFMRILLSAGMLQGIILCFFVTIHFLAFIPLGIIYPFAGFELLSPLMAMVLLSKELFFYNRLEIKLDELLPYRKELGFTPLSYKIMDQKLFTRTLIYSVIVLPLVVVQVMLAFGMGQEVDSLVKAFTHSQGFVFSNPLY